MFVCRVVNLSERKMKLTEVATKTGARDKQLKHVRVPEGVEVTPPPQAPV